MKKVTDRIGQVLLLMIGGWLIISGGSCVINLGANIFALLGLPFIGLGVWIVKSALKKDADEDDDGQGAGMEKQ